MEIVCYSDSHCGLWNLVLSSHMVPIFQEIKKKNNLKNRQNTNNKMYSNNTVITALSRKIDT